LKQFMSEKRYDLCIVGAGVAGALIATEAVRRGQSVVMIEAGRRFHFKERPEQLRRYQTMGGDEWPWVHRERDAYVDSSYESVGRPYRLEQYRVKGVGGSTLHWEGRARRLMPTDFHTASSYGLGVDWPLTYEELEPYYSQAEWELGVSGGEDPHSPPRSRPCPNGAFPLSVDETVWLPIAERLGISLSVSPFAINSAPYDGRSKCLAFAACKVCPSGARYSADWHVARAESSGLCDVLTETVARRIEVSRSGEVVAIRTTNLNGEDADIRARSYVIAAHAVESARLLLLSDCGNRSDQVGRNFMDHIYIGTGGYLPGKRFYPYRVGYDKLESLFWYDGDERRNRGAIKLEFTFEEDPLEDMERTRQWGRTLAKFDAANFGRWIGISAETELLPNPDSRIVLDPKEKDLFGDPVPHVRLAFSDVDKHTQRRAREIGARLLNEIGVREVQNLQFWFGAHQMGTCRMSDDPDRGVVDRDGRVHGTSNLYLAGSSVFPTGGAVQPTLTIAALSLRLANHLSGGAAPR
jgi:choline dehydrogenase-like flavoprotein